MNKSTQQAIDELLKEQKADLKDKVLKILELEYHVWRMNSDMQVNELMNNIEAEIAKVFS